MMIDASQATERLTKAERIVSLDVIRGIAILSILFMNIRGMAGYENVRDWRLVSWALVDQAAVAVQFVFLAGTQRGLLELLFGAGIMIMARRAMTPEGPVAVADLHYRRNILLILFGLFNALILFWPGDILLPYGIAALFLFPFRLLKPRRQLILGGVFLLLATSGGVTDYYERSQAKVAAQQVASAASSGRSVDEETKGLAKEWDKAVQTSLPLAKSPEKQKKLAEERAARHGPLPSYALFLWGEWAEDFEPMEFFPVLAEIAGTMLIGMALFQLGIIQGRARRGTYWALLLVGYAIGLSLRILGLIENLAFSPEPKLVWLYRDLARIATTLGHLAAIHLILSSNMGRRLLAPFQAPGRMPLTTYLFTSFLTMWVLFPGFGLGLHGSFSVSGMMAVAATIIAVEVVATNFWLRTHETGPMEWLWKSLAYGHRQPYRRVNAPVAPVPVPAE